MQYDAIIVGGGIIGMLSALHLHEAGRRVLLVERGATGRESSWAGGGILSPLYPWRYPDSVTELAVWGQARYPEFLQELHSGGGVDPEYRPSGLLILAEDEIEKALVWASRFDATLEATDADDAGRIAPALATRRAGVWLPRVGQARNPRLVKSARAYLDARNVPIQEHTEVLGFLTEAGHCVGVQTQRGDLRATQVLVAGGAWSGALLADLGSPIPIEPVRGQMILFRGDANFLSPMVLADDRYAIPRRDGRIVMGSTLEHAGFDKSTTHEARDDLYEVATRMLPGLAKFEVEHQWSGLRPGKTDNIPLISEHPKLPGLFVNAGHFRNGVVLALASTRLISDLMLGREPILNPAPYAI
ncbi:MAG: glycine oxidase ThiO [Gammaproteobacteria bacterium]|nr:glycine oxidase ThiO [Gammaproteobacteria bacterium]